MRHILRRPSVAIALATLALVMTLTGVAVANGVIHRYGTPVRVQVVHGVDAFSLFGPAYQDLANADARVTVPDGARQFVLVRFSGEVSCMNASTYSLKLVVDDVELDPMAGEDLALTCEGGTGTVSLERSSDVLPPGRHTVRVQAQSTGMGAGGEGGVVTLDDWTLVVETLAEVAP